MDENNVVPAPEETQADAVAEEATSEETQAQEGAESAAV